MNKQTANFYNKFSIIYPLIDLFLKPQKKRLFHEINRQPFGKLLEIGVGNGTHLPLYKTHAVTGIDTSLKMLEIAKNHVADSTQLLQMDGENLLFEDETFDYVVLSHTIAVVDNPGRLLEEAYRVLQPDGKIFILNHFTPNNWLKYVDYSFQPFSKIFHFKSLFHIESLNSISKLKFLEEIRFGTFSYFKLLIYCKA